MSTLPRVSDVAEARADAERRGARLHQVDTAALATKREVLEAIAAALSFPEHAGRNPDALFDALRDLSWLPGEPVLALTEPTGLDERTWRGIERAIADAARADTSRLHAVVVS